VGFNLDDYEPVAVRHSRWLTQHPNGRTITQMVSIPGADICVIRAELWLEDVCIATGYAEEVRGAGNVNRTSHVENCETSAVGRALANAGMAGTDVNKRPSREEMSKVERASAAGRGYLPRSTTAFPDRKTVHVPPSDPDSIASANGVTVKGNQFGELPDWLVLEAVQAGVTEVYDNRDQVAGTKRPWFKATTGGKDAKAFWPPRGTPDPVVATHEDDLNEFPSDEEPF
jgi:hypothetical protein